MAATYQDVRTTEDEQFGIEGRGEVRRGSCLWLRTKKGFILLVMAIAVAVGLYFAFETSGNSKNDQDQFIELVVEEVPSMLNTLREFEKIARLHNNTRSVVNGYNDSAAYVREQLDAAGFRVEEQHLEVPVGLELSSPVFNQVHPTGTVEFILNTDYKGIRYGGQCENVCEVTSNVTMVANLGCSPDDYPDLTGLIAIIQIGECDYFDKAVLAEAAGASAILFMSSTGTLPGGRVRKTGWLMGDPLISVPCLGVTASVASMLLITEAPVYLRVHYQVTMESTYNILASLPGGKAEHTIVFGSHLDSVAQGPGINDNGSGSAMNLGLALEFAALSDTSHLNNVLFVWWGAEEIGLLGSYHFVNQLQNNTHFFRPDDGADTEALVISAACNFDMMGGPNGKRQVHNGTQVPDTTTAEVIEASTVITGLFIEHFETYEESPMEYDGTAMLGGSDFYPFILANIPAGGLATGASAIKTEEERDRFGGIANAWLDPCYHLPCDTFSNVNQDLLTDMAAASASVLWSLSHGTHLLQQ